MKILLLGATGRTGRQVLEVAFQKGFEVSCLVRNPEKVISTKGLHVFKGDVRNKEHLKNAIEGCDYVISVLNISRYSDFPWSGLKSPKTLLSETMQQLINVSKGKNIQKIAVCSAWGVSESKKNIPFWFRWLIDFSNIGKAYRDHERQEKILKNSNLNYTIARPSGLINSQKKQSVRESFNNQPKPSIMISRKAVAQYLVNSLTNVALDRKTVTISKD